MTRLTVTLAVIVALGACANDGEVVAESQSDLRVRVGYDAAVRGQHPERLAAEHCAATGKRAVWYGHDRDGNLHYECE
jgi:Ni,Fe-hydrogenase III small subunit